MTLTTAALLASGSVATAQSTPLGLFALSLHEQLSTAGQSVDVDAAFVTAPIETHSFQSQFGGLDGSIGFMLDPQEQPSIGLRGLANLNLGQVTNQGGMQHSAGGSNQMIPKEDGLTIVPLPSAAFAGFGLLAGAAGIRCFRKIKSA